MNGANHWYPGTRPRNFLANTRREESNAYGAKRYGEREYKYDKSSAKLRLIRPIEWIGPAKGRKVSSIAKFEGRIFLCASPPPKRSLPRSLISRGGKGKKEKKEKRKTKKQATKKWTDRGNDIGGILSIPVTPCKTMQRTWRLLIK